MLKSRTPYILTSVLIIGIALITTWVWIPNLTTTMSVPEPDSPYWRVADSQHMVVSNEDYRLSIHKFLVSPQHITIIYSTETINGNGYTNLTNRATLVGDDGQIKIAKKLESLASTSTKALASITFEPYSVGATNLSLTIPELTKYTTDGSQTVTSLSSSWQTNVLTRLKPQETTNKIFRLDGIDASQDTFVEKGPYGSFLGSSPQGQVGTVSFSVNGQSRYFLVKQDGHIQEISQQNISDIKSYLGITS